MNLKYLTTPSIIFIVGIVLFGSSLLIGNWYNWEPISFAIDLRSGIRQQSPLFRIDLTTNYLIELEVERNLPFEQLNCLLGIGPDDPERCSATPSPVDLKWSVFSSGKQVAEGTSQQSRDGAWGPMISRIIGRFRGDKGQEYIVQIESLKDASVLAPTSPHIVVRVHPIESKGHYVLAQLVAWVALAITGIGLFWLLGRILGKSRLRFGKHRSD